MIVIVDSGLEPAVRLAEADDCMSFEVILAVSPDTDSDPLESAGIGRLSDGYAWVRPSAVISLATGLGLPDSWPDRFEAMVLYARTKGWWDDESDTIRAHIEEGTS